MQIKIYNNKKIYHVDLGWISKLQAGAIPIVEGNEAIPSAKILNQNKCYLRTESDNNLPSKYNYI